LRPVTPSFGGRGGGPVESGVQCPAEWPPSPVRPPPRRVDRYAKPEITNSSGRCAAGLLPTCV
ncbi:Hypothetical protein CINCED_3A007120, partial [Cinara cedri]